jgi:hypothetical protein
VKHLRVANAPEVDRLCLFAMPGTSSGTALSGSLPFPPGWPRLPLWTPQPRPSRRSSSRSGNALIWHFARCHRRLNCCRVHGDVAACLVTEASRWPIPNSDATALSAAMRAFIHAAGALVGSAARCACSRWRRRSNEVPEGGAVPAGATSADREYRLGEDTARDSLGPHDRRAQW